MESSDVMRLVRGKLVAGDARHAVRRRVCGMSALPQLLRETYARAQAGRALADVLRIILRTVEAQPRNLTRHTTSPSRRRSDATM